jgi:alpha-L-rhamnosidase
MAKVLQKNDDARAYQKFAEKIRKAFLEKYYERESGTVGNGGQTQMALALSFGLIPEKEKKKVLDGLVERIEADGYFFDCGVVGLKALYETALQNGISDVIFKMVSQTEFPGYGHWIVQGANTLWQDWDGSMSLNHIMFGSVSEWFFRALAGINPDPEQPGFKHLIIAPVFIDGLDWVQAEHETMYGTIRSGWWREGDAITLKVEVPANTTATVRLPAGERQVPSGSHEFIIER